jgi:outer membrane lipoprotein-sorting protein
MRFQINSFIYLFFFIGLIIGGCAVLPAPPTALPTLKDPNSYFHDILKKSHAIRDVSGYAKLQITSSGKTSTSRNVFFVSRPDLIRIETLGFLSRPALFFTADSRSMSIYVIENNTFYSGETTVENLQRIIGMRLGLREIVQSFLGEPPLSEQAPQKITYSQDRNQYRFTIACDGGKQLIWIDPAAGYITGYKRYENNSPVYEYAFSNFKKFDARFFPLKIDIHHYTNTTDITLELESISFDTISIERFRMNQPEGAASIGIEELGIPH